MTRPGLLILIAALAACGDDDDGGTPTADAAAGAIDSAPGTIDGGPGTVDADTTDAAPTADAAPPCDNAYVDISAGQGPFSGSEVSIVVDAAGAKVLVLAKDDSTTGKGHLALFRCDLDGTACTYTDVSAAAGQGTNSGGTPFAMIDSVNAKLLVVTNNGANGSRPGLYRCDLDGTACTHTDISAGQPVLSGQSPAAVIDAANSKLLVVTNNGAGNANKPALFRCNLDGTACTFTDVSAGQAANSGQNPSAAIDVAGGKLLVVTQNGASNSTAALFRCNLDGTACTFVDISAGQGPGSGALPTAMVDAAGGKLLVASYNFSNSGHPALYRCNLDGTACTHSDLSAGQGTDSASTPTAIIAGGKLLVVTQNTANGGRPALFRCNLDGTGCTYTDISAGQGTQSGSGPAIALDTTNGKLLVATRNGDNGARPALFDVCLP